MTEKALMYNEKTEAGTFSETTWNDLIDRLAILFDFSEEKKIRFQKNRLAKLIAALPFLAKCDDPYRTAISHLTITYLASHKAGKDIFSHNFADNKSLMNRLEPISSFKGGNKLIIDRGMNILAVIMLADHNKDCRIDKTEGKYNPVSSGIWNFDEISSELEIKINSVDCPAMDDIISFEDARAYWWEYR
ncbi:MAG: hypothetical protein JXR86_06645 [Spirochaetales bacterium]|nr:hypothetical protein [Spirochaetales bacterium]